MDVSIFQVAGPVMIGPSSSHTAGAAKLARIAGLIVGRSFDRVVFGLHGSFAKTYLGHGTDRALVAGALGLREDDERIPHAFALAEQKGLAFCFEEKELEGEYANAVEIRFFCRGEEIAVITGASIGGGEIVIYNVDGFETKLTARTDTLIIRQYDRKGVLSDVSRVLAEDDINIGILRLSRKEKGGMAFCVIMTDHAVPAESLRRIRTLPNVLSVQAVDPEGGASRDLS